MHVVVSWDITAEGAPWKAANERLQDALKPHSWARPLSTFYVVRVASEAERAALLRRLTTVAQGSKEPINVVLSPSMVGGQYDGWLPGDMWPKINERTQA